MKEGQVLGHEGMGVVEKIGPNVRNLKVGQRVVASFQSKSRNNGERRFPSRELTRALQSHVVRASTAKRSYPGEWHNMAMKITVLRVSDWWDRLSPAPA
jgi:threonine dehydrogenase-like Zn-dependent dehydrogenase